MLTSGDGGGPWSELNRARSSPWRDTSSSGVGRDFEEDITGDVAKARGETPVVAPKESVGLEEFDAGEAAPEPACGLGGQVPPGEDFPNMFICGHLGANILELN
eukprot:CAMPEP_0202817904 /NCGR_PEP_ID=MMETSP1389-20130828/7963_1 /ASSEMBLY_ACC=CAM_ASM_000865 /TAXON_ID=302021 /ORGANISM="Rhodomonas sp., Strain CCMP768" /LENGTH=103 /DNA_ID=CAMNT_0049490189 /DNA_START=421 /DNA_END=732 /DNA_ORIENTATION=+